MSNDYEVIRVGYVARSIANYKRNEYACHDIFIREIASGKLIGLEPLVRHINARKPYNCLEPKVLFTGSLYDCTEQIVTLYHAYTPQEAVDCYIADPVNPTYKIKRLKETYVDRVKYHSTSLYILDWSLSYPPCAYRSMFLSLVAQTEFSERVLKNRHKFDGEDEAAFNKRLNAASARLLRGFSYEFSQLAKGSHLRQMRTSTMGKPFPNHDTNTFQKMERTK